MSGNTMTQHANGSHQAVELMRKQPVAYLQFTQTSGAVDAYPEGGMEAWLVVLGAWCGLISSMGWFNSLSVLEAWITEHQLHGVPKSTTGWIFSLFSFFVYFCGVQIGPIFDAYDARLLVVPGSIGMVTSIMCLSVSTEFYQFLLSFGILGGVSASLVFYTSFSAVSHWFARRRSLATGVALSAGGFGGICYPLIILYLGPSIGFPWAIRMIGFFNTFTGLLACLLLRKRLAPNKAKGGVIDLKALKEIRYAVVTIATFLLEVALIVPYTYVSSYAIAQSMAPESAYLLNTVFSAAAIPGRILPNYFADRYGVLNVMILTTVACTIFVIGLWLPAGTVGQPAITAFVVLFGLWSGSSISLAPVCIGEVCETEDYGKRTGTTFCIASLGSLTGPPIAGAILEQAGGNYLGVIIMTGVTYLAAMVAYVWARQLVKAEKVQKES